MKNRNGFHLFIFIFSLLVSSAPAGASELAWNTELDRLPGGMSISFTEDILVPKGKRGVIFKDGAVVAYTKAASINELPRNLASYCYIFVSKAEQIDRRIGGINEKHLFAPSADFYGTPFISNLNTSKINRLHYVDFPFMRPFSPNLVSVGCVQADDEKLIDARPPVDSTDVGNPKPIRILAFVLKNNFGTYLKSFTYPLLRPTGPNPQQKVQDCETENEKLNPKNAVPIQVLQKTMDKIK